MPPVKTKKRRWTVLFTKSEKYAASPSGGTGIAWESDPKNCEMLAKSEDGGVVVDADWLAKNWHDWKRTREIPDWAKPGGPDKPKTPEVVKLVKTRNGCQIMEREDRYDVMFRGQKVGQLYYNMRGYVGTLPCPPDEGDPADKKHGNLNIGEKGITAFHKEVKQLNEEWARYDARKAKAATRPELPDVSEADAAHLFGKK